MSDPRQIQYLAAIAATSTLVVRLDPSPSRLAIVCHAFAPREVSIELNAHRDLAALRAWATELGGEMASETRPGGQIHWSFTTTVAGIPVEAWTILKPSEDEQTGGAE